MYFSAQESYLILDVFVHMLTDHDSPFVSAAPCLRLPNLHTIAHALSQETFNPSLSGQQYRSGSGARVFHL